MIYKLQTIFLFGIRIELYNKEFISLVNQSRINYNLPKLTVITVKMTKKYL